MSIGKENTYGQKWGTNYPWQKAMLNAQRQTAASIASATQVETFNTVAAQTSYTLPNLLGKTISLVVNTTNQVVLAPGDYTLVGAVFSFTAYVPAGVESVTILYQ